MYYKYFINIGGNQSFFDKIIGLFPEISGSFLLYDLSKSFAYK